jgi:hypothetical protein
MGNIKYTIVSGAAPFVAELVPEIVEPNIHNAVGTYEFVNIPNGTYKLTITDSNNCAYSEWITVNPNITTTTTTKAPNGDSIVVGQVQDSLLIFDENSTNRSSHYIGYPDENIVELYLWFKTLDGKPLTSTKILNFSISGNIGTTISFNLSSGQLLSDEINTEIYNLNGSGTAVINGQLILKKNFIETYVKYTFIKNPSNQDLFIKIEGSIGDLYNKLDLTDEIYTPYGVESIIEDLNNGLIDINMKF